MNTTMNKNNWSKFEYPTKVAKQVNFFDERVLLDSLKQFWKAISFNKNEHVLVLVKIHLEGGIVYSLSKLFKINLEVTPKMVFNFLLPNYYKIQEAYNIKLPIGISFHYKIKEGKIIHSFLQDENNLEFILFNKMTIGYRPEDYGKVILDKGNQWTISIPKSDNFLEITKKVDNILLIAMYSKQMEKETINWIDEIIDPINRHLIRTYKNIIYEIIDGEIVFLKEELNTQVIKSLRISKNPKINNKIITLDIETIKDPKTNNLIMYLICLYNGKDSYSFFNNSLNDKGNLKITKKLVDLLSSKKYEGYKIYAHNFHSFDSLFLLRYLVKLGECRPILHEGKLISLNFKRNEKIFNFFFFITSIFFKKIK